ncbi:hypothetical protein LTR49_018012 [Elasticomyces elasticus]|nr:hypothetical protein LTR49_018012 [Elasticomyces elasticus]
MDQYGELGGRTGQDVADCSSNLLRLRRDIHYLWDNLYISIVPKCTPDSDGKGIWHAHSMCQDQEVYEDIHNKPTKSLAGRSAEYLFARFAWDIFPKLIGFLQSSQSRRLAVRQANGDVDVKFYTPPECRRFAEGQGRGRSASPTKRSRKEDSDVPANEAEIEHSSRKRAKAYSTSSSSECLDSGVSDLSQNGSWKHRGSSVRSETFTRTKGRPDDDEPRAANDNAVGLSREFNRSYVGDHCFLTHNARLTDILECTPTSFHRHPKPNALHSSPLPQNLPKTSRYIAADLGRSDQIRAALAGGAVSRQRRLQRQRHSIKATLTSAIAILDHELKGERGTYSKARSLTSLPVAGADSAEETLKEAYHFTPILSDFVRIAQRWLTQMAVSAMQADAAEHPAEHLDEIRARFLIHGTR